MKNLIIRTETMAVIKMNEIEDIGADIAEVAHILSDMVSYPDTLSDKQFLRQAHKTNLHNGPELAAKGTKQCDVLGDGTVYDIYFNGQVV